MKKKPVDMKSEYARFCETTLKKTVTAQPELRSSFTNLSGRPIERLYTPLDTQDIDIKEEIGMPGEYPYTRGIHATGYRGKLWTMRQFSGFGTPKETNRRLHYL